MLLLGGKRKSASLHNLDRHPPTYYSPDWFQPWPRDALFSVGRKFLSEMDLGSDGIRAAIERFLPLSFKVVNTAAEAFKAAERRRVSGIVYLVAVVFVVFFKQENFVGALYQRVLSRSEVF